MMKTPDEIKKELNSPIPVHFHISDPEPRLTPLALRDLEFLHTDTLALIQQLEAKVPRWISVEERLPERDKEVLCFFVYPDSTTVCQNVYYGNGHWLGEGSFVTHWMPLPEPPKEEPK